MVFSNKEKKKLIEIFVAFYGEDRREYITKKINETTIVIAETLQDKSSPVERAEAKADRLVAELDKEFCKAIDIDFNEWITAFEFINSDAILDFNSSFVSSPNKKIISQLGFDVDKIFNTENAIIDENERKRFEEKILQIRNLWTEKFKDRYAQIKKQEETEKEPYKKSLEQIEKLKKERNNVLLKLVKENEIKFLKDVENKFNVKILENGKVPSDMEFYLVKLLSSGFSSPVLTDSCAQIFNNYGFNFNTMEELEQSELFKILQSYSKSKEIKELVEEYAKKINEADVLYKEAYDALKALDSKGLVIPDEFVAMLSPGMMAGGYTKFYVTSLNKLKNLIVLPYDYNSHGLIHEVNHVLEGHLLCSNSKKIKIAAGFDILEWKLKNGTITIKESMEQSISKDEYFNEAINDGLTIRILEKARKSGFELPNDIADYKSGYFMGVKKLLVFIDAFIDELAEYRLSEHPLEFKKLIGEENFKTLVEIIYEIMQHSFVKLVFIRDSLSKKLGELIEKVSDIGQYYDKLIKLDLTEEERRFVEAMHNVDALTAELVKQRQKKAGV